MVEFFHDNDINNACTLALDPNYKPELRVKIVNYWTPNATISNYLDIFLPLRANFTLTDAQNDQYDLIVDGPFIKPHNDIFLNKPGILKLYITREAVTPKVKNYDLSIGFDYLKDDNYIRYPLYFQDYQHSIATNYKKKGTCNPNKEHFACFLTRNSAMGDGAIARTEMFHELSKYKPILSGGPHLNNIGSLVPKNETNIFLNQCKFTLAFENNFNHAGYMTEKLFQAYFSGSIPLYGSHPSVQQEVNKKSFISRQDFNTHKEMVDYVIQLDKDNKRYCEMWNQPIITDSARDYSNQSRQLAIKMNKFIVEPYLSKIKKQCNSEEL